VKKILNKLHHNIKKSGKIITAFVMAVLCLMLVAVFTGAAAETDAEPLDGAEQEYYGTREEVEVVMGSITPGAFTLPTANEDPVARFWRVTFDLLAGFRLNGIIFSVTLIFALPFGMVVTFGLMSKFLPLRWFCKIIVWMVRGSPLMLQLFIVFFVPGLLFNMPMRNRLLAALIAFVINYAMYFAEIYRGALENMPKGQFEAGKVLGLSKRHIFFHIILFQVIKNITAPIGNEVITLVKDTSLARVIAVYEMLMRAQSYANLGIIWPLFYSLVFYLIATAIVTVVFEHLERRLARATGE
jgi:polar amino acid transport system permease protein